MSLSVNVIFTNVIVMPTPDHSSREKERKKEKKAKFNPSAGNGEKPLKEEKLVKSGPVEDKNGNMEQEKCRKRVEQVKELFNNWVKELKPQLTV